MQHFGVKFMIITAVSLATSRHLDAGPNAPSLWQPRDMTRNDWLKYHGMSANKWYQTRQKYLEVLRLHAEHTGMYVHGYVCTRVCMYVHGYVCNVTVEQRVTRLGCKRMRVQCPPPPPPPLPPLGRRF